MDLEKSRSKCPNAEEGGMAEGELTGIPPQNIPSHTQISKEEDHGDEMNEVATEETGKDNEESSHQYYRQNISRPLVDTTQRASQKAPVV
jgi:hypothetical protein